MDSLRGHFSGHDLPDGDDFDYDSGDDETGRELPPSAIGTDERRMQVRAYNFWASLLLNNSFPSIEELDPESLPDFGPYSVLLDFTAGIEDPAVIYLGEKLAGECGSDGPITKLSDVPSRSLLSRITDHYLQIIANQAPIGFEAEFVNLRGAAIMYRGILLPFSSDDDTIDFIYGVINWKELADQQTTDALLAEIDQSLELAPFAPALGHEPAFTAGAFGAALPAWNAPLAASDEGETDEDDADEDGENGVLDLTMPIAGLGELAWPEPAFELEAALELVDREDSAAPAPAGDPSGYDIPFELIDQFTELAEPVANDTPELDMEMPTLFDEDDATPGEFAAASGPDLAREPAEYLPLTPHDDIPFELVDALPLEPYHEPPLERAEPDPETMGLADWLASARDLALAAQGSEDRSRQTLYAAIGRAYDFSLAAAAQPESFAELVTDSGLKVQDRAPLTPVVKLVFGADYDKTRLAEFASALSHAHRRGLPRGGLADHLAATPGGLKAVVGEERTLRRAESGAASPPRQTPAERLAAKLRQLDHQPLDAVAADGSEFALLVARRLPTGEVVLLGEIAGDVPLLERAARHLLG